jgi:hypothetical protein
MVSLANGDVAIVESIPLGVLGGVPTGWKASAAEVNETGSNWTLTVYVVCGKVAG